MWKEMVRETNAKGTFRQPKSGKIEYRFPYYDEYGIRRNKSVTAETERKCLDRADEFFRKIEWRRQGVNIETTIPEILYDKVKSDYDKNFTGEQGYDRNLSTIAIIERHDIGKIPIIEVNEYHIELFLIFITKYSNKVIEKIYMLLKTAFRIAFESGMIASNPMLKRDLRRPKSNKPNKKVSGFTEEEQRRYIKELMNHQVPYGRNNYKKQLLLELYTGLRMGEINALKPEDIDFKKGCIYVRRTIARGLNCRPFISTPKTETGVRSVPISKNAKPLLEEALKEMKDNREGLLFYDYGKDGYVETSQVNCFHRRICEKANIEYRGQHCLRHTFATRCIEAEVPAIVLKTWLGHTDIHMTLDIYSDVYERLDHGSIAKYEALMDIVMSEEQGNS